MFIPRENPQTCLPKTPIERAKIITHQLHTTIPIHTILKSRSTTKRPFVASLFTLASRLLINKHPTPTVTHSIHSKSDELLHRIVKRLFRLVATICPHFTNHLMRQLIFDAARNSRILHHHTTTVPLPQVQKFPVNDEQECESPLATTSCCTKVHPTQGELAPLHRILSPTASRPIDAHTPIGTLA